MSVLETIVAKKHDEVRRLKARLPESFLDTQICALPKTRGFKQALCGTQSPNIIAEIKRASPSKGVLLPDQPPVEWDPVGIARAYEQNGARALSVLTDTPSFWGCDDLLGACAEAVALPLLRKEFIVDPYQITHSRWLGADAILLIARCLSADEVARFSEQAFFLGLDVLIEVHHPDELAKALPVQDALIGVNHRDLSTLKIHPDRALELRSSIPDQRMVVGESGITSPQDIARLWAGGIHTFLVGSHLVAGGSPGPALKALLNDPGDA